MTFRTHPADAAVAPSGWFRLPSGLECTMEPLVDVTSGVPGLYARLSQPDAEAACVAVGGRLPTRAEVIECLDASHLLPPVLLPSDSRMASRERCEQHDTTVRTYLEHGVPKSPAWPERAPWDRTRPAGNIGKHRITVAGYNPRVDEAICGWRRRDGTLWQSGVGVIALHHGPGAATRTDYGTTTIAVRSNNPSIPPLDPGPGAPMRPTIKQGSIGDHVGVWQRIIGVTADERFGPATHAKTVLWQQRNGLHADGIVGPQTWKAAGEVAAASYAPVDRRDPVSAACRAALRDANATWPSRDKRSDGTLGDAAHQQRPSDHNTGLAVDITHDPASGCDANAIALMAMRDPRVTYVIWNRRISNRSIQGGAWRPYAGANPHTHHVHISVREDARGDGGPWPWAAP